MVGTSVFSVNNSTVNILNFRTIFSFLKIKCWFPGLELKKLVRIANGEGPDQIEAV